jgi:hypothetical protein
MNFRFWANKKHSDKYLQQAGTFDVLIGQFWPTPAILCFCEIHTIWDFQYFWENLATFFLNAISKPIKNGFSNIF